MRSLWVVPPPGTTATLRTKLSPVESTESVVSVVQIGGLWSEEENKKQSLKENLKRIPLYAIFLSVSWRFSFELSIQNFRLQIKTSKFKSFLLENFNFNWLFSTRQVSCYPFFFSKTSFYLFNLFWFHNMLPTRGHLAVQFFYVEFFPLGKELIWLFALCSNCLTRPFLKVWCSNLKRQTLSD